jgi:hypothetical protein
VELVGEEISVQEVSTKLRSTLSYGDKVLLDEGRTFSKIITTSPIFQGTDASETARTFLTWGLLYAQSDPKAKAEAFFSIL